MSLSVLACTIYGDSEWYLCVERASVHAHALGIACTPQCGTQQHCSGRGQVTSCLESGPESGKLPAAMTSAWAEWAALNAGLIAQMQQQTAS